MFETTGLKGIKHTHSQTRSCRRVVVVAKRVEKKKHDVFLSVTDLEQLSTDIAPLHSKGFVHNEYDTINAMK